MSKWTERSLAQQMANMSEDYRSDVRECDQATVNFQPSLRITRPKLESRIVRSKEFIRDSRIVER
jgi:hypothetical protein